MNKTVAIIGSHPGTRKDFDFTRTDADVWGFNEALTGDWFPRADGIFQMHDPVIWRSKTNRNDPGHYDWLKSGNTPVIFMQDEYEDVPKSERYPLEDVLALSPGIDYFTSSVAYAIALAIYKGYERIEVYGVEMETNTEYGHQRVGVAYWCGVAAGRGIEIDFHSPGFFNAPRYGYDGDVKIPLDFYEERIAESQKHIDGSKQMFDQVQGMIDNLLAEFVKSYKTDLSQLDGYVMALRQNALAYGMADGMHQVNKRYLEKCHQMIEEVGTYLIVRQEFESQAVGAMKEGPKAEQVMRQTANRLHTKRDGLNTNENKDIRTKRVDDFREWLDKFTKTVTDIGRLRGVIQENKVIIDKFDELLRASGIQPEEASVELMQELQAVPV